MDETKVKDGTCVSNAVVYGLNESIKRAKYPLSIAPETLNNTLTEGIKYIARTPTGQGHDQWLTGVIVQFDLTFTSKAWVEAERYHFLDFISSQSTMHRITKFDLDNSYCKYVDKRMIKIMKDKVEKYNKLSTDEDFLKNNANARRILNKKYLEILYSNPAGFKLTAGITTNYRQLKTIYQQRKNHKLPEWRAFCKWIETLPQSELITNIIDK